MDETTPVSIFFSHGTVTRIAYSRALEMLGKGETIGEPLLCFWVGVKSLLFPRERKPMMM